MVRVRVVPVGIAAVLAASLAAEEPGFLRRRLSEVQPRPDGLTAGTRSATYKALFGAGDADAGRLISVARYGELTVGPGGSSAAVSYPAEEQIYYILEGNGTLLYGEEEVTVKKDDFMYLPAGVKHGMANRSGSPVRLLVMGYRIPSSVPPTPKLMLANAGEVPLQILGGHGPTSQFKLLMGTTQSRRDKLAAAHVMVSLFVMDFAPGGTNIPHRHLAEEEIYFVLRGSVDMVAGSTPDGAEVRHPAREGDAFFFAPKTLVGFYSHAKVDEPHDLVVAVRSRVR